MEFHSILTYITGCAIGGNGAHIADLSPETLMNYWKVCNTEIIQYPISNNTNLTHHPDLPRQPIHLLHTLPLYQDLHHLLLPTSLRNPDLPKGQLRPKLPNRRLGNRNLPSLRRTMSTPTRILGPQRRRNMFRRAAIHHRQPSLQCPHGLRHPHPAHPDDLEPPPRMARQARAKRGVCSRHVRLLRKHLPYRRALLDQSDGPYFHRLPGDSMDAHRACCWSDLFQFANNPGFVPSA